MSEPHRSEPLVVTTARLIQELAQIVAAQQDRLEALENRLDGQTRRDDTGGRDCPAPPANQPEFPTS